ncbi:MAG: CHAT domain-containing protein [Chitinophagaceae bacterium]
MKAARISIELLSSGNSSSLVITVFNEHPVIIPLKEHITLANIDSYRQNFSEKILELQRFAGVKLYFNPAHSFDVLQKLHQHGRTLLYRLFEREDITELSRIFQRALDFFNSTQLLQHAHLIEIRHRDIWWIPFEYFPLLNMSEPVREESGNLMLVATRFIGFAALVRRVSTKPKVAKQSQQPLNCDGKITRDTKVPLRFFRNRSIPTAASDEIFFSRLPDIELRNNWPSSRLSRETFIAELGEQLYFAKDSRYAEQSIDAIVHFLCHCETNKVGHRYRMTLTQERPWYSRKFPPQTILVDELYNYFSQCLERDETKHYPLVFLNACGSGRISPAQIDSFPQMFIDNRNRGVIGTETTIPTLLASAFAQSFYHSFFEGDSLAFCIQKAKWKIMENHNNPLGILYTVYANPDLHISLKK